ncbi:hypothetical protein ANAPC4_01434 [Anaplasma phagocytophilum]|nr:hypothetical protein ANAPC4_01434 [Anaplasma phagocytophilum]
MWVGAAAQAEDVFNETGDCFVGALSPRLEKVFGPLPAMLVHERPLQLGDAGVPRRERSLVVLEPVPRSTLQRKVEVLQALLGGPSVMACHALVVMDPVLDVLVDLPVERRRSPRGDGQVNDGWSGHRRGLLLPRTSTRNVTNGGDTKTSSELKNNGLIGELVPTKIINERASRQQKSRRRFGGETERAGL